MCSGRCSTAERGEQTWVQLQAAAAAAAVAVVHKQRACWDMASNQLVLRQAATQNGSNQTAV
jgi:hypothetical protein